MKDNRSVQKYWFRAKTYGYGWGFPTAWQGWIAMAIYLVLLGGGAVFMLDPFSPRGLLLWLAWTAFWSVGMVLLCYLKGPKPRWRWGHESHDESDGHA